MNTGTISIPQNMYLRDNLFDLYFIFFIPLLSITLAFTAFFNPTLFPYILTFDIFFLSNHHVIATYFRIGFSQESLDKNRWLLIYYPVLLIAGVLSIIYFGFVSILFTIFIHWQWYHYGRQSDGISKTLGFKYKSQEAGNLAFNKFIFYMVPVVSFLIMNSRDPGYFLRQKIYLLPIPASWALPLGVSASILFAYWLLTQIPALKSKQLTNRHFCYILGHHLIYLVSYVFINDLTVGWIAISSWHNLQYISYVWHFNTNRVQHGEGEYGKFLNFIGQPKNAFFYVLAGLIFSFLLYKGIAMISMSWVKTMKGVTLYFVANQIIIYHHYMIDAFLWKLRKPEIKKYL